MSSNRKDIVESLRSKSYRHKLVAEHLKVTTAAQVKLIREDRGWTQRQLGDIAGVKQSWISHLEDPDNDALTLDTLKKLGEAFDVALVLRWVPFSQFADWIANLEMGDLAPPGYDDDRALFQPPVPALRISEGIRPPMLHPEGTIPNYQQPLPIDVLLEQADIAPLHVDREQQGTAIGKVAVYAK